MNRWMHLTLCAVAGALAAALFGCATVSPPVPVAPAAPSLPAPTAATEADRIDLAGLKHDLGLDGAAFGYFEKAFDTCRAGFGFSSTQNCRTRRLIVIRFQLQCRNSEGSEDSTTSYQTSPIGAADVRWTLSAQRGTARTDGDGRAEIVLTTVGSAREQKLRLTHENDFLLVTAEEARRIVAPKSWCP